MKTIMCITVKDYPYAVISETTSAYFVDLGTGLGEGEYPKCDFTLTDAICDQLNIYREDV